MRTVVLIVAIDPVGRGLSTEQENTEENLVGKIKRKQNMVVVQKRCRNAEGIKNRRRRACAHRSTDSINS